jgi:hypothetical protein
MTFQKDPLSGNPEYPRLGIIAIVLLLTLGVAGVWVLHGIQAQVKNRLEGSLQTVLNTTDKGLQNWTEQTEIDVAVLADSEELRTNVQAQLRIPRDRRVLLHTTALENIRRLLSPPMRLHDFLGFVVIALDGVQVAAESDDDVGRREIADNNPSLLPMAMAGENVLGLPFESHLFTNQATQREYPIMTASVPIRDRAEKTMAVLTFRLDPRRDFTQTTRLGRLGKTGETMHSTAMDGS